TVARMIAEASHGSHHAFRGRPTSSSASSSLRRRILRNRWITMTAIAPHDAPTIRFTTLVTPEGAWVEVPSEPAPPEVNAGAAHATTASNTATRPTAASARGPLADDRRSPFRGEIVAPSAEIPSASSRRLDRTVKETGIPRRGGG